jgi:hypothetical protein
LLQKKYCELLSKKGISFKEQVPVPNGRIDVLTDNHIIEIKKDTYVNVLLQAIGQLKYYSIFFPAHSLKIIVPSIVSTNMKNILDRLNIGLEVFNA